MTSRHAFLPIVMAAFVLALLSVLPFAGCALPRQGLTAEPDGGAPCNDDAQCADQNPCTVDTCTSGICSHAAQPDAPAPSSAQVAFDCKVVQCVAGVPEAWSDDQDAPLDAEDCTVDTCSGGVAAHTAKPDGTMCSMGSNDGLCSSGVCKILCTSDAACDDGNPCTQEACDLVQGVCSFLPLNGVNTPGAVQKDGDCRVQICVDGKDTDSADDSDLPVTATDCDDEICTNGVPSNPPLALNVSCGPTKTKYCDGAGACVECNDFGQCPGSEDDCKARSCAGHVCGMTFSQAGTPLSLGFQTPGNCLVAVCDGAGHKQAQDQVDDADVPVDGNACTKDVCTNGAPSNPVEPPATACGVNSACNAVGQCGCANDGGCVPPNTCGGGAPGTAGVCGCTKQSCAALGKTCGSVTDGCFATQDCNDATKDGTETDVDCGGAGTCASTCGPGKQCNSDGDCASGHCADGVCCNTACSGTCVACTAAKKGTGVDGTCGSVPINQPDPNATTPCVGSNACDGANNCKKVNGQSCSGNGDCVSGSCADGVCCNTACNGTCLACAAAKTGGVDGVCSDILINQPDTSALLTCTGTSSCDGVGSCKKNVGQACAAGSQCVNGNCVDGVCCGSASCPTCQSCNLATPGTCTNIGNGNTDNNPAGACSGADVCDGAGVCKKANGQTCGSSAECVMGNCVDGYCCNSACTATCKACNVAGSLGACSDVPMGTADSNATLTCTGSSTCDGSGACKKVDGQTCNNPGDCLDGNCVDGYCCNTACTGTCKACNVPGSVGVCSSVALGQADPSAATPCIGVTSCDGAGNCKKNDGQMCAVGECVHGNCTDGYCCNSACQGTCQACDVAGSEGVCSNVPPSQPDNNAAVTCSGTSVCDGAGACKLANGQTCPPGGPSGCESGACADGVCCDTTCTGSCKSCNGSTPGTCSTVTSADDDDSCIAATNTCSASGACLLKPGQPCTPPTANLCASGVCLPLSGCQ